MPDIVTRALLDTVCDIGQLTKSDQRALAAAVKQGVLCKGRGGHFPASKTVYAPAGYDFAGHRAAAMDYLRSVVRG